MYIFIMFPSPSSSKILSFSLLNQFYVLFLSLKFIRVLNKQKQIQKTPMEMNIKIDK